MEIFSKILVIIIGLFIFWPYFLYILIGIGLIVAIAYTPKYYRYRKIVGFGGRLLGRINHFRRKKGLIPLGRVRLLDIVTSGHSKSMARRGRCDHQSFGKRCVLIANKTGITYIGENCYKFPAKKYDKYVAKKLVAGWLRSPGHRANIINPDFKRTGIGIRVRKGYVYACQIFIA